MQEVFEKIVAELEKEKKDAERLFDGGSRIIGFQKAIEIVKQEAKEYKDGWIPVSERLPEVDDLHEKSIEECESYLVQRRCGVMEVAHYIKVYGDPYFVAHAMKIDDVVKWQPVPESYKGE